MKLPLNFRELIAEYIRQQAKPIEKFGHQPRLYVLTRLIGESQIYDDDVVYAAAWLHDLGVFTGHRPEDLEQLQRWDNTAYAMQQAPGILERLEFPAEKIPAVVEVIRTHQPSAHPTTLEGKILRDADILEQLGSIGILRTVCKVGRDTRFQTFTAAVNSLQNSLNNLPGQLQLESSRKIAESKIRTLRLFLDGTTEESYQALY